MRHLSDQISVYGDNILVNLVNQCGHEKPIKIAFEELVQMIRIDQVKYIYFDFHAECSNMRWDRVSLLIDRLKDDLMKQEYIFCKNSH